MVGKSTTRELLEKSGMTIEADIERDGEVNTWQDTLADVWRHLEKQVFIEQDFAHASITANLNVRHAVDRIRKCTGYDRIEVLATGSLYIVGSTLDAVSWTEEVAFGSLAER
jgi:hypothetical protein